MLKRLRLKFVGFTMLIVTVMLCIIFSLVVHFIGNDLEQDSIRTLQMLSQTGNAPSKPGSRPQENRFAYFVLQVSPEGRVIAATGNFDLTDSALLESLAEKALSGEKTGMLRENNLRYQRTGLRITFVDTTTEQAAMAHLIRVCALIGVVSLLAFLGISIWLSRVAVKPVAQAWQEQKQFVADASHELKTPLTVIMTNAELLQEEGQTDRTQCAENILFTARQMRTLTESLLELARSDSGTSKAVYEPVDLSAAANLCLLTFEPVCFEKGLSLTGDLQPGLTVQGSPAQLGQCVEILLDNAVKYCAPSGEIRVCLARQGNHCLLQVDNPGEAISKADLKNIFQRFYRVDKARSRDGSFGLGLSIAQAYVTAHGGKIWAESRNGINSFFIQLPLA